MKRRHLIHMLLCIAACVATCTAQEVKSRQAAAKGTEPRAVSKTFSYDRTRVWQALVGAINSQDLFPQEMDESAGNMRLHQQGVETVAFGDANGAVAKLTTKKVTAFSTWQMLNVTGTIDCKALESGKTEIRIVFRFDGNNVASSNWEKLASSGVLEQRILNAVESRLTGASSKK